MSLKLRTIAIILSCFVLGSCTSVRTFNSKANARATDDKVTAMQVVFDPTPPTDVNVLYKYSLSPQQIDEARISTRALIALFSKDFESRFPEIASKAGVTVRPAAPAQLKLSVVQQSAQCGAMGCISLLFLRGALFDRSSPEALWAFTSQVGQPRDGAKITDDIFDAFANELLSKMKRDGVI